MLVEDNSEFLRKKDVRKLDDRVYDALLTAYYENKYGVRERYGRASHPHIADDQMGQLGMFQSPHCVFMFQLA